MAPQSLALYKEMYRCMYCSSAVSDRSVKPFVTPGPLQTLPVSHFGEIANAKIWLIATNPKGRNRNDSNVGFLPAGFTSRTGLSDAQVAETFSHFSGYFRRSQHDSYFDPWINVLDGLELAGTTRTFAGGGICCVDLIKCPTVDSWGNVVRGPDKQLIYGCFSSDRMQRYLSRQVELHDPRVLIFSAGLGAPQYYPYNCRLNRDLNLRGRLPKDVSQIFSGVWSYKTSDQPAGQTGSAVRSRLSIGLKSDSQVERVKSRETSAAIQALIRAWERETASS